MRKYVKNGQFIPKLFHIVAINHYHGTTLPRGLDFHTRTDKKDRSTVDYIKDTYSVRTSNSNVVGLAFSKFVFEMLKNTSFTKTLHFSFVAFDLDRKSSSDSNDATLSSMPLSATWRTRLDLRVVTSLQRSPIINKHFIGLVCFVCIGHTLQRCTLIRGISNLTLVSGIKPFPHNSDFIDLV